MISMQPSPRTPHYTPHVRPSMHSEDAPVRCRTVATVNCCCYDFTVIVAPDTVQLASLTYLLKGYISCRCFVTHNHLSFCVFHIKCRWNSRSFWYVLKWWKIMYFVLKLWRLCILC